MTEKIKLNFSILFDGAIWKILSDEVSNMLLLEVRNADMHSVEFHSINLEKAELTTFAALEEQAWWLGAVSAYNGKGIIHGYADEENPNPSGIYTYDLKSGNLLWQKPTSKFTGLLPDAILAISEDNQEVEYNLETGIKNNVRTNAKEGAFSLAERRNIIPAYPLHYPANSTYFEDIFKFILLRTGHTAIEAVDYLEYNSKILLSYYTLSNNKLENKLLIIGADGNVLFEETLAQNLKGIGIDTFFILANQLFYIKNKNELFSYEI